MQRCRQRFVIHREDRRSGDDQDVPARLERGRHHPERLTESPAHSVPDDRSAELASSREPEARLLEVGPADSNDQQRIGPDRSLTLQCGEVLRSGEHHQPRRVVAAVRRQTVSFLRPWARRAESTRRPPVVFIRARKPCSLARCRFLGWKVCFIGRRVSLHSASGSGYPERHANAPGATRALQRVCRRII